MIEHPKLTRGQIDRTMDKADGAMGAAGHHARGIHLSTARHGYIAGEISIAQSNQSQISALHSQTANPVWSGGSNGDPLSVRSIDKFEARHLKLIAEHYKFRSDMLFLRGVGNTETRSPESAV